MRKKMKKKILSFLCMVCIILFCCNYVLAINNETVTDSGKQWLDLGEDHQHKAKGYATMLDAALRNTRNGNGGLEDFAGLLMGLGIFVVAIVGVILGIRLMFTQADQKAKAKEALIIYLIGSVIIFGAIGIWRLLVTILDGEFLYK